MLKGLDAVGRSKRNQAQLALAEVEFEAIPELEFDQTANLAGKPGMISGRLLRMRSQSRHWRLIRRWVGNPSLQKYLVWRSVRRRSEAIRGAY